MKDLCLRTLAVMLMVVGFVVFWLPIPVGAPLMGTGMVILLGNSHDFAARLKRFRRSHPRLNQYINRLEAKLPLPLREAIEKSSPDKDRTTTEQREGISSP